MIHYADSAILGPAPRPGGRLMADSSPAALVTGAGGGMGRAIAERLSARGSRVLAADLKPRPATSTRRSPTSPATSPSRA